MGKTKSRGNGEGTIYKVESKGLWAGQLTMPGGKRKTVYGKTRKAVAEKLQKLSTDGAAAFSDLDKVTLSEFAKTLIDDDHAANITGFNTYHRAQETLKIIQKHPIAEMPAKSINEVAVKNFLNSIADYSDSVIRKCYAMISRCMKEAVRLGIVTINPVDYVRRPKSTKKTKKIRALTVDEQRKLVQALENHPDFTYKNQILLSLYTGARMGEVLALAPGDINLIFKTIQIRRTMTRGKDDRVVIGDRTKTYAGERLLPLNDKALAVAKDALQNCSGDTVFPIRETANVNDAFNRFLKRHSILDDNVAGDVTCHSLRHTYATRCIESGVPAKVLQHLLGHRDIQTTLNTYCDVYENLTDQSTKMINEYLSKIM